MILLRDLIIKWQINDSDVSAGTLDVGVTKTATAKLTYTRNNANNLDAPDTDTSVVVDFTEVSTLTLKYGIYDITVDNNITANLRALGAGGGLQLKICCWRCWWSFNWRI